MQSVRVIACIEAPVVIKKILKHLEKKAPTQAALLLPERRALLQSGLSGLRKEAYPCNRCCCTAQRQQGVDWPGEGGRLEKGQMTGTRSGQDGPFGQAFTMIRLQSSGSDCPAGMRFWGKGANTSYNRTRCGRVTGNVSNVPVCRMERSRNLVLFHGGNNNYRKTAFVCVQCSGQQIHQALSNPNSCDCKSATENQIKEELPCNIDINTLKSRGRCGHGVLSSSLSTRYKKP